MIAEILLTVFILIALLVVVFFLSKKLIINFFNQLTQQATTKSLELSEERNNKILKEERDRMEDKLKSKLDLSEQTLDSKKDLIKDAIENMRKEINQSRKELIDSEKSRLIQFQTLTTQIEKHEKVTESLHLTTDKLFNVLSNNQMRGGLGQDVAEDLLKIAGFVKGQNYFSQEQQLSGNQPDFTVRLPSGVKINIDVKFPLQALVKLKGAENDEQKKKYLAEFKIDIKNKIKEVTTRDYISSEENTVDFVIMFIPNEMIFSFIYENFDDVWKNAIQNKVVMCGPFSFTAILRMVQKSYDNFHFQENLYDIYSQFKRFETEYKKFSDSLDTLGDKISASSKEFDKLSGVRDRKLLKIIEKISSNESMLKVEGPVDIEQS